MKTLINTNDVLEMLELERQEIHGYWRKMTDGVTPGITKAGVDAWYYSHLGAIEICNALGLVSDKRCFELETAWRNEYIALTKEETAEVR